MKLEHGWSTRYSKKTSVPAGMTLSAIAHYMPNVSPKVLPMTHGDGGWKVTEMMYVVRWWVRVIVSSITRPRVW